ncbi:hypothetical protein [Bordetella hinzii]|uniref:hypothetical protein n=1 Tax=Bordetella hinzii TaxID=103855 RepID=UPI001F0ED148|nr:hypothetical protein [Bordetella hinzii]
MLDRLWEALVLPFFLGLAASWLIEALLQPRPRPPWRRPLAANLTHAGVWLLAFALEVALFKRPYFAVANVLAIELVLVVVSLAKYRSLQEPFVYPDFEYFLDAMRHPRLYLPFLGWTNLIGLCAGYGLALWAGLAFESSLVSGIPSAVLYPMLGLLALVGLALAIAGGAQAGRGPRCRWRPAPPRTGIGLVGLRTRRAATDGACVGAIAFSGRAGQAAG